MTAPLGNIKTAGRILMGPGPSNVHPRVLKAMATPLVGHLDPEFLLIMDSIQEMLRTLFNTKNELTIPISGTGSAGMETCFANLVEPGDRVLICVNGVFGERMCDVAARCGAEVVRLETKWGETFEPDQIEAELKGGGIKIVSIVHAETSTGALQPLNEIGEIVHKYDALFLVDTVTSLGGHPVEVDKWGIDACYSGTQKCLSCPPGLSPVTFSDRSRETLLKRKTRVQSWYLDLTMVEKYWGKERTYHHTAPVNMNFALYEALRIILEEGLEKRYARHKNNHLALIAGLEAMGLRMVVAEEKRLWPLNTVYIPGGVQDSVVRKLLLDIFNLEIGGGLGAFKGKVWRISLMGESCTLNNVLLCLEALEFALAKTGISLAPGVGVAAALAKASELH